MPDLKGCDNRFLQVISSLYSQSYSLSYLYWNKVGQYLFFRFLL
jgi:hypothetical protein